jgi:GTPase SAR1 family protein
MANLTVAFSVCEMPTHKISVLGDAGVGKTALIIHFISDYFVESVRNPKHSSLEFCIVKENPTYSILV